MRQLRLRWFAADPPGGTPMCCSISSAGRYVALCSEYLIGARHRRRALELRDTGDLSPLVSKELVPNTTLRVRRFACLERARGTYWPYRAAALQGRDRNETFECPARRSPVTRATPRSAAEFRGGLSNGRSPHEGMSPGVRRRGTQRFLNAHELIVLLYPFAPTRRTRLQMARA